MKYKILIDYGLEGFKFNDGDFETVDEAVKKAVRNCFGSPFLIVNIIDWEASPTTENKQVTNFQPKDET